MSTIYNEEYLQEQMGELKQLQQQYKELKEHYDALHQDYMALQQQLQTVKEEYEEYKASKSKAGRRPNDEKWTAKYRAFAKMKEEGCKREEIQEALNMSRATYFRYNKIYSGEAPDEYAAPIEKMIRGKALAKSLDQIISSEDPTAVRGPAKTLLEIEAVEEMQSEPEVKPQPVTATEKENHEGLVLDPATGEYVTPEGLRRRKKLAEIRARRAAEEQKAAEEKAAQQAENGSEKKESEN